MSRMMEHLESRVLFIASAEVILADLSAIKGQGQLAKSDLKAAVRTAAADMAELKAAVNAAHPTATERQTFTKLKADEAGVVTKYKLRVTNILTSGTNDGEHLLAVLEILKAHPNSVVVAAKVKASLAALQGVFSDTVLTGVETTAGASVTLLDSDADAIATAIPSTQTAVSALESHLAADLVTLATQGTAIQTSIATLATALS